MASPDSRMDDDSNELDYPELTIQAIRGYTDRITALEKENAALKATNNDLEQIVSFRERQLSELREAAAWFAYAGLGLSEYEGTEFRKRQIALRALLNQIALRALLKKKE